MVVAPGLSDEEKRLPACCLWWAPVLTFNREGGSCRVVEGRRE